TVASFGRSRIMARPPLGCGDYVPGCTEPVNGDLDPAIRRGMVAYAGAVALPAGRRLSLGVFSSIPCRARLPARFGVHHRQLEPRGGTMRPHRGAAAALASMLCLGLAHARELSLDDRVNAQEAIERVYYAHQMGATRPFEEAVPRETIERKVRTYLDQS